MKITKSFVIFMGMKMNAEVFVAETVGIYDQLYAQKEGWA